MNNNVIDSKYCSNCKKFIIGVDSNGNFVPAPQLSCPFCGNSLKYPLVSTDAEEFDNEVIKSIDKSQMVIGVTNPSLSERITNFVDVHDYRNTVRECVNKISEGLYKQAIAENTSIDKLNDKIDVIMNALGLQEDDTVEDKTEDVITEEETTEDTTEDEDSLDLSSLVEDNKTEETKEDEDEVKESLDETVKSTKEYTIKLTDNAKYKDWYQNIKDKDLAFDDFDSLVSFLYNELPVSYTDINNISIKNASNEPILLNNVYFTVYHNIK